MERFTRVLFNFMFGLLILGVILSGALPAYPNPDFKVINTNTAPLAIGHYSQAIKAGGFIFISGQIPIDPKTQEIIKGDISQMTERCLENIKAILESSGSSLNKVVKVTIFLTDLEKFSAVNTVYGKYFKDNFPARSCVQVQALPKGVEIEIEAIAVLK